jgi:hypothetical protein
MKKKAAAAVVITVMMLSVGSPLADDAAPHVNKAERRLLKTDLNILFEQYKKARTLSDDLDFQAELSQAQGKKRSQQEQEDLDRQRDFLRMRVQMLRAQIKEMGERAEKLEPGKEKDKSQKKHDS